MPRGLVVGSYHSAGSLFATVEILHLVLISYRGIWGLAWRLLATTSVVVLVCVGVASRGRPDLALMRADRGYHLIFAAALISCLALIRYYFIRVENAYKVLLVGFCFYSCVKILLNTVLYDYLYTTTTLALRLCLANPGGLSVFDSRSILGRGLSYVHCQQFRSNRLCLLPYTDGFPLRLIFDSRLSTHS